MRGCAVRQDHAESDHKLWFKEIPSFTLQPASRLETDQQQLLRDIHASDHFH
jgi:hypothetical protein